MKFVPNAMSVRLAKQVFLGKKHSPHILFAAGVVGMIGTAVTASRATLKLTEVLETREKDMQEAKSLVQNDGVEYDDADYKKDMATMYVRTAVDITKLYGPTVLLGGFSVAALTGSHVILSKRNTALIAAYGALEKAFSGYRERVAQELGADEEQLRYAQNEVVKVDENGKAVKSVSTDPSIYGRFFDEYSKNWKPVAEYNKLFLQCQQNYANDLLLARGHLFLNEVYDMLGIERSKAGTVVGWKLGNGDNHVDFGVFENDNLRARDFIHGREASILLDFNVDGLIWDKI